MDSPPKEIRKERIQDIIWIGIFNLLKKIHPDVTSISPEIMLVEISLLTPKNSSGNIIKLKALMESRSLSII